MSHDQPLPTGRTASGGDASVSRRDDDPVPSGATTDAGGAAPQQQPDVGDAPTPAPAPATSGRPEASRSLYIGKLHPSVNEAMLLEIFSTLGPVQEVKVIRDKLTSLSAGYGFVTYYDARCAALALQSIDRRVLYGQEVRVNWASQRDTRPDTSNHFHIFIGDLAAEVDDQMLLSTVQPLGGCSDARVVWDLTTGRSKGYGFVSFYTKADAENAMAKLSGSKIGSRTVRCGWAHHKKDAMQNIDYITVDQADPLNANVYIGSISPEISDDELRGYLEQFGPLLDMRVFRKNCYGFAQYTQHSDAVMAILGLNGLQLGGKVLRLSWGRHQARAAAAATAAMSPGPMMAAAAAAAGAGGYRLQQLPSGSMVVCQAPGMTYPFMGTRMMMPTMPGLGLPQQLAYQQSPMYGDAAASPQQQLPQQQPYGMLLMQQQAAAARQQQLAAGMQRRPGGGNGGGGFGVGGLPGGLPPQTMGYGGGGLPRDIGALGASLTAMQLGSGGGGGGGGSGSPALPPMSGQQGWYSGDSGGGGGASFGGASGVMGSLDPSAFGRSSGGQQRRPQGGQPWQEESEDSQ